MIAISYLYPPNLQRHFTTPANSILLGRSSTGQPVDLDLTPDTTVSRRHARLTCDNGVYWLEDLNSKYGTWVNSRQITTPTLVLPGDKVQIGRTTLEILDEEALASLPPGENRPAFAAHVEDKALPEQGVLTNTVSATLPPATLLLSQQPDQASLVAVQRRLAVFYELGMALGTVETVEPLLKTVVEFLCEAIPGAQRGALLLRESEGSLIPKAYFPEPIKPVVSLNLARQAIEQQEAFTWRNGEPGRVGTPFESILRYGTQAAMYAPLIWKEEVLGIIFVDNFETPSAFDDDDLRLLMAMANQVAMFIKNHSLQEDLRRQEVIRSNLLRQFSPQVAEHLENMLKERGNLGLGGKRADPVTILMTDIHGFTALSAEMEPNDVVDMLNQLFGVCIPIIFRYDGTVDKYVGDAILAVYGSPDPDDNQWEKAVRAALEMQQAIQKLGARRQYRGLPVCHVGIGIHTGAVLHGFIGAKERMEYTVIGDTVNRATRYCHGAAGGEVVISRAVYERVQGLVEVVPKTIQTKHPETESDLEAYVVKGLTTRLLKSS